VSAARRVIVVGGGVVGVACADALLRAGCAVTVLDRGRVGGGASHANCGYVCPSHVLPLAGPGAVRSALATLFRRDSPLAVRWRLDPAMWAWLWRFARQCNRSEMLAAARALQGLLGSSRRLYDDLFAEGVVQAEWEQRGLVFVFQSAAADDHYAATDQLLSLEFGLVARRYRPRELREFEPALVEGLAGGWYYATDAHLRPDRLMASWRAALDRQGAVFHESCPVERLVIRGKRVAAVVTPRGELPADDVVIAAGAWTPLVTRQLGLRVPIQPGKGYSITTDRPQPCPRVPLLFEEHRVAATPFTDGFRLGSLMEFTGYDDRLDPKRAALLTRGAANYLQPPAGARVVEQWWGWRPMVPDGKPLIGRCPRHANAWIAAGHGMLGVSMAPATGRLLSELMTGRSSHLDPTPFNVDRF
jgi:D-amino-acid dehydrogenase